MRKEARLSVSSKKTSDDSKSQRHTAFYSETLLVSCGGKRLCWRMGFVDGRKAAEFRKQRRADDLQKIDIKMPASARFLTLVSTDGDNGCGMDQIGVGDPQVMVALPPMLTEPMFIEETRQRPAEFKKHRNQITNRCKVPKLR